MMKANTLYRTIFTLFFLIISALTFGQPEKLFRIVENQKVGYIDEHGKIIIPPEFLNGNEFSEGLASVRVNGRYGFIDTKGKFSIPPKYEYALNFINGITCVYIDGQRYFIDKNDSIILDSVYESIQFIDKNKAIVQTKSGRQGVFDLYQKKLIIDTIFESISSFEKGRAIVTVKILKSKRDNPHMLYAVIDSAGNFIVNFGKYKNISAFVDGYARVTILDKLTKSRDIIGAIDINGNLVFQRPHKNRSWISGDFHDGFAVISLYKYWIPEEEGVVSTSDKSYDGYINLKGDVVLDDTLYKYAKNFSAGRAFVQDQDGNYHMIDTKFKRVGTDTFDNIENDGFNNSYAVVEKDYSWGIIDTTGKYIIEPKYDYIHEIGVVDSIFFYGIHALENEKLYGFADLTGKIITIPMIQEFDNSGFINGLLKAIINNRLTYVDKEGNIIWQEKIATENSLRTLNIDFMNRGYFYAYSKAHKDDYGGFGSSLNSPIPITTETFLANKLSIIVDSSKPDSFQEGYKGLKVYVVNNSKNDIEFSAQDSRLYMKVQAKDHLGKWRDIEYLPSSWCGNSYHTLTLDPNHYWSFITPQYEGEIKTKLRIELEYLGPSIKSGKKMTKKSMTIYSNEYDGGVNPGQFWNKRQYYSSGLMDPYND